MNARNLRFGVYLSALIIMPAAGAEEGAHIAYSEPLQQLEMRRDMQIEALRFNAFSKHFDIRLAPNQNVLSLPVRERIADGVGVYRGKIDGMPGSWVRLVVADGIPRGLLWDGNVMYGVEAGTDASSAPYIFRMEDLTIPPGTMTCADAEGQMTASELLGAVANEMRPRVQQAAIAESILAVAVIADFEFATDKGSDAQTELVTRINNVDGIFSEQLGVQINLAQSDVFASSNDPFTDESDPGNLLGELSDYRAANASQNANGLTHLFTGRELDGTTVGIAFTGALCSRRFGAGLTQATHSVNLDSLIAAHEIGHNFGAPHDGTSGSACEDTPQDFLMAPRLNGSDTFSACSIVEMQADVNRASCVTAAPTLDIEVVANQPGGSLLGDSDTVTFVVNNIGTEDASGAEFEVSLPSNVTLDSITSSVGNCSSGGGSATCTIGSIAAGSSSTVDLVVTSTAAGDARFSANVTAAGDTNGGNNNVILTLRVEPAVDVQATAAAISAVQDQSTTARVTIENNSSIVASSVEVTVSPDSGLRIDSANWSPGNCSLAGGVATCAASSLAVQSNNTINVQLTGLSGGSKTYSVSVSAAETDRDTSNNDVQGQVTVGELQSDSGGGGVLGLLELITFCLFLIARRSRLSTLLSTT